MEGPEGYDIISWMVSPVVLAAPSLPERAEPAAPVEMKPRCDDTIFKARGDCVDTMAGPKSQPADTSVARTGFHAAEEFFGNCIAHPAERPGGLRIPARAQVNMMKTAFRCGAALLLAAYLFAQQTPPGKERDLKYEKDEPVTIKTPTGRYPFREAMRW